MTKQELKELKNSTLLKELVRRIKLKEIRFNYDSTNLPQHIIGLISWNTLDEYSIDFNVLEKYLEKLTNHE